MSSTMRRRKALISAIRALLAVEQDLENPRIDLPRRATSSTTRASVLIQSTRMSP
jgi:hypothetical protein